MGPKGEHWFEYQTRTGRFRAVPVNAKGWLAGLAAIAMPHLAMFLSLPLIRAGGPVVLIGSILGTNALAFFIMWRLVLAKGRRRP